MDSVRSCLFPERREPGRSDQLKQIINTAVVKTGNTFSVFSYFISMAIISSPFQIPPSTTVWSATLKSSPYRMSRDWPTAMVLGGFCVPEKEKKKVENHRGNEVKWV